MNEEELNEIEEIEKIQAAKKKRKGIIIAVLIGLLIGCFLIFTFSSYKILLSPKKASFLTYLSSDILNLKSMINAITTDDLVKILTANNKKINFNIASNSKEISGSAVTSKEFLALKLNDVNENYLLLENKDLDKLWENLGLSDYELPNKIDFSKNPFNFTKLEQLKISNYINKLLNNVIETLEIEKFIENDKKEIVINDETKQLKTIEVKLSESDLFMLQKEALVLLENENILDLIINKINNLGLSETVSKKEIRDTIDEYVVYLDYARSYYNLQNKQDNQYAIIYRMYVENNNVVAREILEKYSYENQIYEDIIIRIITSNNEFYEIKSFTQDDYNSAYYNIISDRVTNSDNTQIHNITYAIEGFFVEYSEDGEAYQYIPVNSGINYKLEIKNFENKKEITFNEENSNLIFNAKYSNDNATINFINNDIIMDFEIIDDKMEKETLINQKAIVLNDKPKQEIISEFSKIGASFNELNLLDRGTEE